MRFSNHKRLAHRDRDGSVNPNRIIQGGLKPGAALIVLAPQLDYFPAEGASSFLLGLRQLSARQWQ
jgi:hypothetical protein